MKGREIIGRSRRDMNGERVIVLFSFRVIGYSSGLQVQNVFGPGGIQLGAFTIAGTFTCAVSILSSGASAVIQF